MIPLLFRPDRFRGHARLFVWMAAAVSAWPLVIFEAIDSGYGCGGVARRLRQELAMARGASKAQAMEVE